VTPIHVAHDAPGTHGFIFDFKMSDSNFRFIYVADCGHGSLSQLNQKCRDADLIAIEFNHDEELELESRRPRFLINRVLGPDGHLSNKQAAELLGFVRSENLKNVVQLHLSSDCNTPELAMNTARQTIGDIAIHQTSQNEIGPVIEIASFSHKKTRHSVTC
jgi:phosphoribosyl 1,2-cyclic phosphodiesterase